MRNNVVFLSLEEKEIDFKKKIHIIMRCLIEEEKVVLLIVKN